MRHGARRLIILSDPRCPELDRPVEIARREGRGVVPFDPCVPTENEVGRPRVRLAPKRSSRSKDAHMTSSLASGNCKPLCATDGRGSSRLVSPPSKTPSRNRSAGKGGNTVSVRNVGLRRIVQRLAVSGLPLADSTVAFVLGKHRERKSREIHRGGASRGSFTLSVVFRTSILDLWTLRSSCPHSAKCC